MDARLVVVSPDDEAYGFQTVCDGFNAFIHFKFLRSFIFRLNY